MMYLVCYLMFFFILDAWVKRMFEHIRQVSGQTVYYFIHIFFNVYTIYITYESMYYSVSSPHLLETKSSVHVSEAVIAFHLYHAIIYWVYLDMNDYLHHVMTIVSGACSWYWDGQGWGQIIIFWTVGLPGLFYYLPLFLLKMDCIGKKTEVLIQYYVALWIRSPGILYANYYTMTSLFAGLTHLNNMPQALIILNILLLQWNAQYFLYLTMRSAIRRNIV
jgi:hypothetical protein